MPPTGDFDGGVSESFLERGYLGCRSGDAGPRRVNFLSGLEPARSFMSASSADLTRLCAEVTRSSPSLLVAASSRCFLRAGVVGEQGFKRARSCAAASRLGLRHRDLRARGFHLRLGLADVFRAGAGQERAAVARQRRPRRAGAWMAAARRACRASSPPARAGRDRSLTVSVRMRPPVSGAERVSGGSITGHSQPVRGASSEHATSSASGARATVSVLNCEFVIFNWPMAPASAARFPGRARSGLRVKPGQASEGVGARAALQCARARRSSSAGR